MYRPLRRSRPRGLVDGAYAGFSARGHAADTILIGETASGGTTLPTPFVRALYCLKERPAGLARPIHPA